MAALSSLLLYIREAWSRDAAERLVFTDERCFYGGGVRICSLRELRQMDKSFKERHRKDLFKWLVDVFMLRAEEAAALLSD